MGIAPAIPPLVICCWELLVVPVESEFVGPFIVCVTPVPTIPVVASDVGRQTMDDVAVTNVGEYPAGHCVLVLVADIVGAVTVCPVVAPKLFVVVTVGVGSVVTCADRYDMSLVTP